MLQIGPPCRHPQQVANQPDRRDRRGKDSLGCSAWVQVRAESLDLADRIHKRRRATELIDHAQQLATQRVIVHLITQNRTVELRTLTPDQLLDLANDDSGS